MLIHFDKKFRSAHISSCPTLASDMVHDPRETSCLSWLNVNESTHGVGTATDEHTRTDPVEVCTARNIFWGLAQAVRSRDGACPVPRTDGFSILSVLIFCIYDSINDRYQFIVSCRWSFHSIDRAIGIELSSLLRCTRASLASVPL